MNFEQAIIQIGKLRIRQDEILILKTGPDFQFERMDDFIQALREKLDWRGVLVTVRDDSDLITLDDYSARRIYEMLKERFEKPQGGGNGNGKHK